MKFFNVYGPNEYHKGDMQSLVAKNTALIARGDTIKLFKSHKEGYADGAQLRDFVYVKDCTESMRWIYAHPEVSGLFNIGTGKARSFVDLINAIGHAIEKNPIIEFIDMPTSIRSNYQYFTEANMNKLISAGCPIKSNGFETGIHDYITKHLNKADKYR
jgi:ADP-L-glycero-D-manno-heptose 6-epimerase